MDSISTDILAKIMHYCAYQERCHSEVRYKLVALGARGNELEQIIIKLIEENFLNESRFAASYVRGKFRHSEWGKVKIVQHLQQKEVSAYCINKALKEIDDKEYLSMIDTLIAKKDKSLPKSDNKWTRKQKIIRYLAQRGFEFSIVMERMDCFDNDN